MSLPAMTRETKWRKTLAWLRKHHPAWHRIVTRRVHPGKRRPCCGQTTFDGKRFLIEVDTRQDWTSQVDTLLHEWAHVKTWRGNDDDDHGEEWGIMFAKLYRGWIAWDYGRDQGE